MRITTLALSILLTCTLYATEKPLHLIGVASCSNQWIPMPAYKEIIKHKPDLMVMMGDNVYSDYYPGEIDPKHKKDWEENPFRNIKGSNKVAEPNDTKGMVDFFHKMYGMLSDDEGFKALRESTPFIATWDDHDYGRNDVLADFRYKEASRKIFLDFWNEPKDSPRWTQKGGIYTSYMYGPKGKRTHIIMLDTRFNRTPQYKIEKSAYLHRYEKYNQGDYLVNPGYEANMLGEEQWEWLETELKKEAELHIIVSSIQVLAEFNGWEAWSLFPTERERLYTLIKKSKAKGVIITSGDVHYGEIVKMDRCGDYPIWELTSSGINQGWPKIPANNLRVDNYYDKPNFGFIRIDWESKEPSINFELYSEDNKLQLEQKIPLSSINPDFK